MIELTSKAARLYSLYACGEGRGRIVEISLAVAYAPLCGEVV